MGVESAKYLSHDTIAALTTPVGGAIAMIRASGPGVRTLCEQVLSSKRSVCDHPREMMLCELLGLDGKTIDQVTAVFFKGPASYTGEDSLELFLHGSPFIASKCLQEFRALGIRGALPGEFSFRAVRNGKLDVQQAEAVAELIASSNDQALAHAIEKLQGTQRSLIQDAAEELRTLASQGELGIDFSDQDVEELGLPSLKARLEPVLEALGRLAASFERGVRIHQGVRVAFVGLPNAGKSAFFNALLGEDRSIVSEIAGTTRDVVRETLTLTGRMEPEGLTTVTFRLEDTAGLRDSVDPIERQGVERSIRAASEADLLVWIVDVNESVEALIRAWERLSFPAERTLGILTKSDLNSQSKRDQFKSNPSFSRIRHWVSTSALTGAGISEAAHALVELSARFVHRAPGEQVLTKKEHQESVTDAISHLERALRVPTLDLFSGDLRQALHSLGPVIGETPPDELLGRIFSGFCIGK